MPNVGFAATVGKASGRLEEALLALEAYCDDRQWAGADPYDALNSELFARTPLARSPVARIVFTQFLKRSPLDLRRLLRICPHQDAKGLALFLMARIKRVRRGDAASRTAAARLAGRLLELRSPGIPYSCWGYSFPWQTRQRLVPRAAPNLVCTTFAAHALLDAYEAGLGSDCLRAAASAGEYLSRVLYWTNGSHAGFAYPLPDMRVPVHNANLLGAALLCRVARLTGDRSALPAALAAARYSVGSQREDGGWAYGLARNQQWIDNFHTGYNLCALQSIASDLGTSEFDPVLAKGFRFYLAHFFTARGAPRYFHDRTYPIDIHAAAQSIITLSALRGIDPRADPHLEAVVAWTMRHMWDPRGFFYYRVLRSGTIRTSYMRWSQAWMCLALSTLLERRAEPNQ